MLEAFGCQFIGIIIAFFFNWKVALVASALSPFVIVGGVLMSRLQWKSGKVASAEKSGDKQDPYEQANALISEVLLNYRTVISFGEKNITHLVKKYDSYLTHPNELAVKNAHYAGVLFGYSQGVRFIFCGVVFYVAAVFIKYQDEDI